MSQPLITIGIPVYNRIDLITETIHSALSQTYRNIEIIINDNRSTDGTWELLQEIQKQDERIHIYQNATNLGPVKNWQEVYKHAKGEYFHMLWSDDVMKPEFIQETLSAFTADTAFVVTGNEEFDGDKILQSKLYGRTGITKKDYLLNILLFNKKQFPVSPVMALFRTKDLKDNILNAIPNSDNIDFNRTGGGPDLLFFLLASLPYDQVKIVDKTLIKNRNHSNSITIIESKNLGLRLNYDWARHYFISNYYKSLLPVFKAYIQYRNRKYDKAYANMLHEMERVNANFLKAFFIFMTK